jgi:hypothetical protein
MKVIRKRACTIEAANAWEALDKGMGGCWDVGSKGGSEAGDEGWDETGEGRVDKSTMR